MYDVLHFWQGDHALCVWKHEWTSGLEEERLSPRQRFLRILPASSSNCYLLPLIKPHCFSLPRCFQCDVAASPKPSCRRCTDEGTETRRDWWLPFQIKENKVKQRQGGSPVPSHLVERQNLKNVSKTPEEKAQLKQNLPAVFRCWCLIFSSIIEEFGMAPELKSFQIVFIWKCLEELSSWFLVEGKKGLPWCSGTSVVF